MNEIAVLLITMAVLAVWDLVNVVFLVYAWASGQLIPEDKKVVVYMAFNVLCTLGVLGWAACVLWRIL
jgi:hypothetical protein